MMTKQFVKTTCFQSTGKLTDSAINLTLFGIAHHLIVSHQAIGGEEKKKKKVLTVLVGNLFSDNR